MKIPFGQANIDALTYASQGNAILGIRGAGKTWAGVYMAERLMTAAIPIIAFDPIGRWRYLRVAGAGEGFPVVVAGGEHGDLPLTPQGAPEIVRAAMRERVSLVIDLYSMQLSKADWRTIVERCIRVLLYENKGHGLRHIFLEEAAEFAPQKVTDGYGRVYAEIEKLARMGGNALLGYTLINQRSEEVNKAVLELCDTLILMRQKGRRSLDNLGKWLALADAKEAKRIASSLPTLAAGECWYWPAESDEPIHTKVPMKRTFEPDRRAVAGTAGKTVAAPIDVAGFVGRMSDSLEAIQKEAAENDPGALKAELAKLRRDLANATAAGITGKSDPALIEQARSEGFGEGHEAGRLTGRTEGFAAGVEAMKAIVATAHPESPVYPTIPIRNTRSAAVAQLVAQRASITDGLSRPQQAILDALAWLVGIGRHTASRTIVGFLANASPKSSGFERNVSVLSTKGLLSYPQPGELALTRRGHESANPPAVLLTNEDLHGAIRDKISTPQWAILEALIAVYPDALTREELADRAGASAKSSGFERNVSVMSSFGFVTYPVRRSVAASDLLFLA